MLFQYKARDNAGRLLQGNMEAENEKAVVVKLEKQGHLPVSVSEIKPSPASSIEKYLQFKRVKFTDINTFTRLLYTLQNAGLPLLTSINTLAEQSENPAFKEILESISKDIAEGLSLSESMQKHPKAFDELYVNMIQSGEVSGKLPEILERLAILGEHDEEINRGIKAALRYPMIVTVSITVGFLALVKFIVPKFERLYDKYTAELPMPTQLLLNINYVLTNYWLLIIVAIFVGTFIFQRITATKQGKHWWDGVTLKFPIFGPLLLKLNLSRFCNMLASLMKSGVPIIKILELSQKSVKNAVLADVIGDIRESVNEGKGMIDPMKQSEIFPPIVIQMVKAGEDSGELPDLLIHISNYYDVQIKHTIDNLMALIEPILIFVLGLAVMLIAMGIFMPIWNMMELV